MAGNPQARLSGLAAGALIPGKPLSVQRKVIATVKKALNNAK